MAAIIAIGCWALLCFAIALIMYLQSKRHSHAMADGCEHEDTEETSEKRPGERPETPR